MPSSGKSGFSVKIAAWTASLLAIAGLIDALKAFATDSKSLTCVFTSELPWCMPVTTKEVGNIEADWVELRPYPGLIVKHPPKWLVYNNQFGQLETTPPLSSVAGRAGMTFTITQYISDSPIPRDSAAAKDFWIQRFLHSSGAEDRHLNFSDVFRPINELSGKSSSDFFGITIDFNQKDLLGDNFGMSLFLTDSSRTNAFIFHCRAPSVWRETIEPLCRQLFTNISLEWGDRLKGEAGPASAFRVGLPLFLCDRVLYRAVVG